MVAGSFIDNLWLFVSFIWEAETWRRKIIVSPEIFVKVPEHVPT